MSLPSSSPTPRRRQLSQPVNFSKRLSRQRRRKKIDQDRVILLSTQKDDNRRVEHWTNIRKAPGAVRYMHRKMHPDENLAFRACSSGTTGLSKSVMLSHRNVAA